MYIFCMHICEFARIRENFHGQLASCYIVTNLAFAANIAIGSCIPELTYL